MCRATLMGAVCFGTLLLFGAASSVRGEGPDPTILHMECNTAWRYRDPYAKREFVITVANVGDMDFVSTAGTDYVRIFATETSTDGYVSEYPIARVRLDRLAAGEEVTVRAQYFQLIERRADPARTKYRAEIVYDAGATRNRSPLSEDANLTNNKAAPESPVEITLLPRVRR